MKASRSAGILEISRWLQEAGANILAPVHYYIIFQKTEICWSICQIKNLLIKQNVVIRDVFLLYQM